MLNWYRASPLVVPKVGETVDMAKVPKLDPAQLRVRMPHLVIWGMQDRALLPVTRSDAADYCDHPVVLREIEGADHWVVHQRGDEVIARLRISCRPCSEAVWEVANASCNRHGRRKRHGGRGSASAGAGWL